MKIKTFAYCLAFSVVAVIVIATVAISLSVIAVNNPDKIRELEKKVEIRKKFTEKT